MTSNQWILLPLVLAFVVTGNAASLSPMQMPALFAKFQISVGGAKDGAAKCVDLVKARKWMHYPDTKVFGTNELLFLQLDYSLANLGPPGQELRAALAEGRLDEWLAVRDWSLLRISDHAKFVNNNKRLGLLPDDQSENILPNGFIAHLTYTLAIAQNKFPIADPHDVISHLPSFLGHEYPLVLREHAALVADSSRSTGGNYIFKDDLNKLPRDQFIDKEVLIFATGPLRNFTVENWSHVALNSSGKPFLFLQGNISFNAFNDLVYTANPNSFLDKVFIWHDGMENPLSAFQRWSLWRQFANNPENHELVREAVSAVRLVTMDKATAKLKHELLLAPMVAFLDQYPSPELRTQHLPELLDQMASIVESDAQLNAGFSEQNRFRAAMALIRLSRAYMEQMRGMPMPSGFQTPQARPLGKRIWDGLKGLIRPN